MVDWVLDWELEDIKSSDNLTPYKVANPEQNILPNALLKNVFKMEK